MARKEKQFHFIYKTTNLLNGKYYYGMHSTDDLNDGYMGSGKRLKYSINKHGKENHIVEILEYLPNRKSLAEREKEIVSLNEIAKEDCMNLKVGGYGGLCGMPAESLNNIRYASSIRLKEQWKNGGDEYRNIISKINTINLINAHKNNKIKYDTFKGKKHSEKTKELMRQSKIGYGIGETNSQFGTCWIMKDNINKKIKKSELNLYLELGWISGRKLKNKV